MDAQSRINAMIAYFFLGPLFLLAKPGTPMSLGYVRGHAKRASIIMSIGLVIIGAYIFLLSELFQIHILGISLDVMILASMMSVLVLILIHGAYRAYQGVDASEVKTDIHLTSDLTTEIRGEFTEEQKIRILASFIPFLGVLIAEKYQSEPYAIGKKVGSLIAFVLITLIVFFGGSVSTLVFVITIVAIVGFIMTAVYLFVYDTFLKFSLYSLIPTYASIEAHIMSTAEVIWNFFRVAFGGDKYLSYSELYEHNLARYSLSVAPTTPYILPTAIIALPCINLLTLPSLLRGDMRAYRGLILQGLIVTILTITMIWFYGVDSYYGLYILFPIVSLLTNDGRNILHRAPGTSPIVSLIALLSRGQEQLHAMGEKKEEVSFIYEEEKK